MATIDPTLIDPTKPAQGEASTANVRANEAATQTNFERAKSDIEALENGKADKVGAPTAGNLAGLDVGGNLTDSGSAPGDFEAAGAVSAHNLSGAAHGGVEASYNAHAAAGNPHSDSASLTDFTAHKAAGGTQHPLATTGAGGEGFAPALSGTATEYLDGTGAWSTPPAGGEVNTNTNAGAGAEIAKAKVGVDTPLRSLVSGDASVIITENPDEIDLRATGAGGGESNTSTTPAVVGANEADINMAKNGVDLPKRKLVGGAVTTLTQSADAITIGSSDMVTGTLRCRVTPSTGEPEDRAIGSWPDGGTPAAGTPFAGETGGNLAQYTFANIEAAIDHASIQNVGTNTHAQIDAHIGASAPHPGHLTAVVDDTTPQLGGDLETQGNVIVVDNGAGTTQGFIAHAASGGVALGYYDGVNPPDGSDGGVVARPGRTDNYGVLGLPGYAHSVEGGRQAYISPAGDVYGVDPPAPSWSQTDNDTADYDLGQGGDQGAAVQITGLSVSPGAGETIEIGETYRVQATVWITVGDGGTPPDDNLHDKPAAVSLAFGANGVLNASTWLLESLGPYFNGQKVFSFTAVASSQITESDTIDIWARREPSEDGNANPWIFGDGATRSHSLLLSKQSAGGGGGTGDVVQGPGGGATGELAWWSDYAGKLVQGGSTTIPAATGYAWTERTDSGTTVTPDPLTGQIIGATLASGTLTIAAVANEGQCLIRIPDITAVTVQLAAGYTGNTVNSEPASGSASLLVELQGGQLQAIWRNGVAS